jgi:hypothetical protein
MARYALCLSAAMRLATVLFVIGSLHPAGCGGGVDATKDASSVDQGTGADAGVSANSDSGVARFSADATPGASDAFTPGSDSACDPTETISAGSYDRACGTDADCVGVGQGNVCDPCLLTCTTTAINVQALPQFKKDLAGTPAGDPSPRVACSCAHSAGFAACCRDGVCRADVTCLARNSGTADAATPSDPGSGPDTGGDGSPPVDGPLPPVPDAGHCVGALVLHLGDTIQGNTCGGATGINGGLCASGNNPVVFVFVDAPDGVAIELTPSLGLSILGFAQCDSQSTQSCSFGGSSPFDPVDVRMRLFAVERSDTMCGDFSLSVRAK